MHVCVPSFLQHTDTFKITPKLRLLFQESGRTRWLVRRKQYLRPLPIAADAHGLWLTDVKILELLMLTRILFGMSFHQRTPTMPDKTFPRVVQ